MYVCCYLCMYLSYVCMDVLVFMFLAHVCVCMYVTGVCKVCMNTVFVRMSYYVCRLCYVCMLR